MALDLDMLQTRIEDMEEAVLLYASKRFSKTELDMAWDSVNVDTMGSEADFSEYLIYDYMPSVSKRVIDYYKAEGADGNKSVEQAGDILDMMQKSVLSVYEVMSVSDKVLVKDLFTKVDFEMVTLASVEPGMLALGRLYPCEGKYFFKAGERVLDASFREPILSGMMSKLRQYEAKIGRVDIDVFIKKNPSVIYMFNGVIEGLIKEEEGWDDDELIVFEAYYVFKERKEVLKVLLLSGIAKVIDDFDNETIFSLHDDDGGLLAELVVYDNRLDLECRSEEELAYSKELLENILGTTAVFGGDRVVGLDSLM